MTRYDGQVPEADVADRVQELVATLNALNFGLDAKTGGPVTAPERGADAAIVVKGTRLTVEVKRDVRDADARALLATLPAHFVVVADRLSPGAKELLERHHAGWFDRRGDLRVELPGAGLLLKTPVPAVIAPERGRATNPFTATGLDVAIAMLLEPTEHLAVREIARSTRKSHGRVSEIVAEFRSRGLVNRDGTPAVPDLFDEVAEAWRPRWVALGARPKPDPSLRLSGSIGAVWREVPLVVAESWPPELYVRDEFALHRLVITYPPDMAHAIAPPARAAVCPSAFGFDQPLDLNPEFPVANYLVIALDLAQDEGRGREALDAWYPKGVARVW